MMRLNGPLRSSLSSKASMMGAGNTIAMLRPLMISVLRNKRGKFGEVKKNSKCFNPTHGLPSNPRNRRKSLKAMTTPHMGK
jgi:hypothetical protein